MPRSILVYGFSLQYEVIPEEYDLAEPYRFVKVVKLENCRINVIRCIDGVIATGNQAGEVHFYDFQLKLLYWLRDLNVDCVKDLRFNLAPRSYKIFDPKCNKRCLCWEKVVLAKDPETGVVQQKLMKCEMPMDATTRGGKPLVIRDFCIRTQNQGIVYVDFITETYTTILKYRTSYCNSITLHPEKTILIIGNNDGTVLLLDFHLHIVLRRLDLREKYTVVVAPKDDSIKCTYDVTVPELSIACVKYSPSGAHLACGLNTGQLLFLAPTTVDILTKTPFKDTKHAIKEIAFSDDSLTMATADVGRTVCVYKYDCDCKVWRFIGKHRAHYKDITALLFLPRKNPDGEWKLISLGADRVMVEYDIGNSSDEYLELLSLDRMEQTGVPLGAITWPPPDLDPRDYCPDLPLILVATDEHKYKLVNYDTAMTLATVLAPRYDSPVSKLRLINKMEDGVCTQYLLFATKNVIGLQQTPLDGNPWKHLAMMGHPTQLTEMRFRETHGALFTIGTRDACALHWATNYKSLDSVAKLGGEDLDPYYCLIENGRPGWLFQEVRDLFYYIQILCQGTFSPAIRKVKDYIPIDSLPDMMRALGFFPSEYEVENLVVEARFKVYLREPVSEIDFEEFVKLYLNHRPAFGQNLKKIKSAFKTLATCRKDDYFITRDTFVSILTDYGENFSRELAWYLLSILSGHSFEERAQMTDDDFSFLPERIRLVDLVSSIMGVREFDLSDQTSVISTGSQLLSLSSSDEEP